MKTKDVPSRITQPEKSLAAPCTFRIDNESIPCYSKKTRDFNKKLCSVGSEKREILFLDPRNELLEALYEGLKRKLINVADPEIIFSNVIRLTRCCFPNADPDEFIQGELKKEKPIISLSQFILEEQGHSRHHALLNAYFLSRLVEDKLLFGTVMHYRKKLQAEVHAWNIFQDTKGKVYSIDSSKNERFCINSQPGKLTTLYSQSVETEINQTFRIKKDLVSKDPIVNKSPKTEICKNFGIKMDLDKDLIDHVKGKIEKITYPVDSCCFWEGGLPPTLLGEKRRVPHRLYEIYKEIQKEPTYSNDPEVAKKLWERIQDIAKNALNHPRDGRFSKTTSFYEEITELNLRSERLQKTRELRAYLYK